jgi:Glycosyltransferase family 87
MKVGIRTRRLSANLALWLALIGAASMLDYHQALFRPRLQVARAAQGLSGGYSFGNDFYQIWLTSREWLRHRSDPYSPEMTREIQIGLYGRLLDPKRPSDPVDQRAFPYPAFADLLFWPASEFAFPPLRIAVVCLLGALTCISVPLWLRALDWNIGWRWLMVILLLTLSSYPALEALYAEQLGLFVAFLLAASLFALRRQRFVLAGFLMAITTVKPQMTVLAILFLLCWSVHDWRARGRFCIGFFSILCVLVGLSLAVLPHWIQSWTRTILAYRHYTRPPLVQEVLTSYLGPHFAGPATLALTAIAIAVAMALAWRNRAAAFDSFTFWITLSLLLAITTIVILPGQAVYDHLILIPGILLLARNRSVLRHAGSAPHALLWIGGLFLFWPWIAAFFLILLRPWLAPGVFDSTAILSLPIRTAASLPLAVLALLAWTIRLSPVPESRTAEAASRLY